MALGCYPCTQCNDCGMFDAVLIPVCANCEHPMPVGVVVCPQCGGKKVKMIKNPKFEAREDSAEKTIWVN